MTSLGADEHRQLVSVLQRSKDLGFLGPGPVEAHMDHAMAFDVLLNGCRNIMDLGSGGGVPGLVLALHRRGGENPPSFTLVDANRRRCDFLSEAVRELGIGDSVTVVHGRAERLARSASMRHRFDCVVARSFGPPAVVAECAVGFLTKDGRLIVSEPPGDTISRWDPDGLASLGLRATDTFRRGDVGLQLLEVVEVCDERFPRRDGVPAKRPLF